MQSMIAATETIHEKTTGNAQSRDCASDDLEALEDNRLRSLE